MLEFHCEKFARGACSCLVRVKMNQVINLLLDLGSASDSHVKEISAKNLKRYFQGQPGSYHYPEAPVDYEERIKFMSKFYEWIPVKPEWLQKLTKNNEVSRALRTKANEFFVKRDLQQALKLYNLAVMFAEPTGEELGLAFANRSALMLEQKDPNGGLKDIELALKSNYPDRLMGKLEKRREKLVAMLEDIERSCVIEDVRSDMANRQKFRDEELLKLKNPSPTIPSAENFVEIGYTEEAGRQLVVNKDVPVGTVVIVERPFTSVNKGLLKFDASQHCDHCGKFFKNGIPCKRCVFVMYCSEECRSSAEFEHDKFVCNCLSSMYVETTESYLHLAFRIVCKVGPEELYRLFTTRDPNYFDTKKPFGTEPSSKYESDSYLPIHHLVSHSSGLEKETRFVIGLKVLQLVSVLEASTTFIALAPKEKRNEFKNFVAAILLRLRESLPHNGMGIQEIQPLQGFTLADYYLRKDVQRKMKESVNESVMHSFFGTPSIGIYAVGSLMNHSCDPSVVRVNDVSHGTMAIVTTWGMKKGEPLTTSYGEVFPWCSMADRKQHLKTEYHFDCHCVACRNDWPSDDVLFKNVQDPEYACSSCSKQFSREEKGSGDFLKCCLSTSRTVCRLCGKSYQRATLDKGYQKAMIKFKQEHTDILNNRPFDALKASKEVAQYLQVNIRPGHAPDGIAGGNWLSFNLALALILRFAE